MRTEGNGSTLNRTGAVTENQYDHLVVNDEEATAELIMKIPEECNADSGWPSDEVLECCGATFLANGDARVVKIGDRTFSEGLMESIIRKAEDDMAEALGKGRPNKTTSESEH